MADHTDGTPRGLWYLLLHNRVHRSWRQRVVHWGFMTSLLMVALMFLDILAPSILWPWRYWIGMIYIMFQLAEIVARDALDMSEVMEDHIFSFIPAMLGLLLLVMHWTGRGLFTLEGISTMWFWLVIAWTDFIFGLAISMRILSTPYRREETPAPH